MGNKEIRQENSTVSYPYNRMLYKLKEIGDLANIFRLHSVKLFVLTRRSCYKKEAISRSVKILGQVLGKPEAIILPKTKVKS